MGIAMSLACSRKKRRPVAVGRPPHGGPRIRWGLEKNHEVKRDGHGPFPSRRNFLSLAWGPSIRAWPELLACGMLGTVGCPPTYFRYVGERCAQGSAPGLRR